MPEVSDWAPEVVHADTQSPPSARPCSTTRTAGDLHPEAPKSKGLRWVPLHELRAMVADKGKNLHRGGGRTALLRALASATAPQTSTAKGAWSPPLPSLHFVACALLKAGALDWLTQAQAAFSRGGGGGEAVEEGQDLVELAGGGLMSGREILALLQGMSAMGVEDVAEQVAKPEQVAKRETRRERREKRERRRDGVADVAEQVAKLSI
jgi:hypothetical protein